MGMVGILWFELGCIFDLTASAELSGLLFETRFEARFLKTFLLAA